jgi:hypothetical protein
MHGTQLGVQHHAVADRLDIIRGRVGVSKSPESFQNGKKENHHGWLAGWLAG